MNFNTYARPIETEEDVESIIVSEFVSIDELLRCVNIAKKKKNWELRNKVVDRLMQVTADTKRLSSTKMVSIAKVCIALHFGKVEDFTEISEAVGRSFDAIEDLLVKRTGKISVQEDEFKINQIQRLNELRIHLAEPSLDNYHTISKHLRHYDRPDLAIETCEKGINEGGGENVALKTTYIAALDDAELYPKAHKIFDTTVRVFPKDSVLLVAGSRLHYNTSDNKRGYELAKKAFEINQTQHSLNAVLRGALLNNDMENFDAMQIRKFPYHDALRHDGYTQVLALKILIDEDELDRAQRTMKDIGELSLSSKVKKVFNQCKSDYNEKRSKLQEKLFD